MQTISLWAIAILLAAGCDESPSPSVIRIDARDVLLGTAAGGGDLVSPVVSLSSAHGYFFAFDWNDPGVFRIYSSAGAFQGAVGRRGAGPGEYETPAIVTALPDSAIGVVDRARGRLTVLDLKTQEVVRTEPLGGFMSLTRAVPHAKGLVVNGSAGGIQSMGLPLHIVSARGDITHSFGAEPAILGSWDSGAFIRYVAVEPDGTVWAAHRDQFLIELWDISGQRQHTIRRDLEWFPPVDHPVIGSTDPAVPPTPRISGLWRDAGGRLWVFVNRPRPDWTEELEPVTSNAGRRYRFASTLEMFFTTHILVIDPSDASVVAEGTLPHGIGGVTSEGHPYAAVLHDDIPLIRVWHLNLRNREEA